MRLSTVGALFLGVIALLPQLAANSVVYLNQLV